MKTLIWIILVIVALLVFGYLSTDHEMDSKVGTYDNGGTCDYGRPCELPVYYDESQYDPDGSDYGMPYIK